MIINEQQEHDRVIKGMEIYKAQQVERLDDKTFLVKNKYVVEDILDELFTCTCKDFAYRTDQYTNCKHINSVLLYILNGA